jgi:hypothetical protein
MTCPRVLTLVAVIAATSGAVSLSAQSLLQRLLRIAGLTAAPSQLRAPGDAAGSGNIWVADLDRRSQQALTTDGDYRSPVFSPADGSIYALRAQTIVRVPAARTPAPITIAGVVKLVGFDAQNPDELIVLVKADPGRSPLAVVSLKSGSVAPLPFDARSDEERQMLAQIQAEDRLYGQTRLYTKRESKQGMSRKTEWTDVYVQRGTGSPENVSACDGIMCGQPALSPDGRRVAFVKGG